MFKRRGESFYVLWGGAAAAPEDFYPGVHEFRDIGGHLFWRSRKDGLSPPPEYRYAGVGVRHEGDGCDAAHVGYGLIDALDAEGAVCPYGVRPQGLGHDGEGIGWGPQDRPRRLVEGHGGHDRKPRGLGR